MRIILLNDSFPPLIDGVANAVTNYAEILTDVFHDEVVVATPRYPNVDYDKYPYRVLAYQSLNTSRMTAGYRTGNAFSPEALLELRKFKPDIIHAHCPFSSLMMGRHVRYLTGAPLVFTYHTKFDVDIARAVKLKRIQSTVINTMINTISISDEVWTVSRGAGENLRSLGFKGDYKVISNGVDYEKGEADSELVEAVTGSYDLPDDIPVYVFVGRILNYKGLPLILDALNMLNQKDKDFRMVFVGDGPDLKKLKQTVSDYNLDSKIFFTGRIEDREILKAWYTRADLFLFPSTYDTNGIVVREAAACGVASVLIEGSCAAEGVTDRQNGYLIEENADSLAKLLLEIGEDKKQMRLLGKNAMNELYISWKDAVSIARENYLRIING